MFKWDKTEGSRSDAIANPKSTHPAIWPSRNHGRHSSKTATPRAFIHASVATYGTEMSWSPLQRKEHKYESPLIYILEQTQKIKSMDLGPTIYINSSTLSIL